MIFHVRLPFCLIELSEQVLAQMSAYRQGASTDVESGGVLLGARRGPHFEVVEVTVPQPDDFRTHTSFIRSARAHERLARSVWMKSGKRHGYLGEWHTHPEATPIPSPVDYHGWQTIFLAIRQPLVHVVVGTSKTGLWYCDSEGVFEAAVRLRQIRDYKLDLKA